MADRQHWCGVAADDGPEPQLIGASASKVADSNEFEGLYRNGNADFGLDCQQDADGEDVVLRPKDEEAAILDASPCADTADVEAQSPEGAEAHELIPHAIPEAFPSKARGEDGKMSTFAATTNLITCMIGASVLSLPRMVANSGWVLGPGMLAFAGFISYRASMLVNRAVDATGELRRGVLPRNVGEVVDFCFGPRHKAAVMGLTCFFQVAKCGVYFVVIGTNLHFWADSLSSRQCTLVAVSCGIWLIFIRNITVISKWSIIGVIASVVYLGSIGSSGLYAAMTTPTLDPEGSMWPLRVSDLPQTFAVMLYAYSPADVLPVLKNDMQKPEELPRALLWSHLATGGAYVSLATVGYLGWGRGVQGNVLESMCDQPGCRGTIAEDLVPGAKWLSGYVLSTAVIANLTVTVPIVLYCVFRTLESEHAQLQSSQTASCCMRLAVVLLAVSVAVFVPFFVEILAVLSTALLITLQILLPSVVTLSLSRKGAVSFGAPDTALFLLGLCVMVVGLRSAIANLALAVSQA